MDRKVVEIANHAFNNANYIDRVVGGDELIPQHEKPELLPLDARVRLEGGNDGKIQTVGIAPPKLGDALAFTS